MQKWKVEEGQDVQESDGFMMSHVTLQVQGKRWRLKARNRFEWGYVVREAKVQFIGL
jgi:hypothetical protein